MPLMDPSVDVILSRDLDSDISMREVKLGFLKGIRIHGVGKSKKKSISILRAKRATFTVYKNAKNCVAR